MRDEVARERQVPDGIISLWIEFQRRLVIQFLSDILFDTFKGALRAEDGALIEAVIPTGFRGLMLAAVAASLMSSADSGINSC